MTTQKKNRSSNYTPGVQYNSTNGATRALFEDPQEFAKAIPVEDGFFRDPSSALYSIIVRNLGAKALSVSCCKTQKLKEQYPAYRENEEEIDCFELPAGESSHIVIPPHNWNLSIERYVQDSDGSVKQLSFLGRELRHIRNKSFVLHSGCENGDPRIVEETCDLKGYTIIKNRTQETVVCVLSKANTAYPRSPAETERLKISRLPDRGNKIVESVEIPADGEYHYYHFPGTYCIRALEVNPFTKASFGKVVFPSMTNYVEDAETVASAGQTVVFLKTDDNDGSIEAVTYDTSDLKFVEGRIAINLERQINTN